MKSQIRPALTVLLFFSALTGLVYPAVVTAIAQTIFPYQANGSLISRNGRLLGSELIGQPFDDPRYFWGRPSAAGYNAAASSGSNLGSTNPALFAEIKSRIALLRSADPGNTADIPVDLVTASGSGLDPHISLASALYQHTRVARVRGLPDAQVKALVEKYTEYRQLFIFGEPRVNVLLLNLALDGLQ